MVKKPSCLIGFDGFTDDLVQAVRTRESPESFIPMETISEFGQIITSSSGVSCNIEFVTKERKLGGNAPILANALIEAGHQVNFIGSIGKNNSIEPLFQDMASKCQKVISIAPSAHTDALEFNDGKVILGKHESIINICFNTLLEHVSKTELIQLFDATDLFASANWTMFPHMNELWKKLKEDILPFVSKKKRLLFIDLADPRKRTDHDLKEALSLLTHWGPTHDVILGLNAAEAQRVALLCGLNAQATAQEICKQLSIHAVIVHTKEGATVGSQETSIFKQSPFCAKPKITTGAGDNFNAGFCSGLLYKLSLEDSLTIAIATAGFYIRKGKSPSVKELVEYLQFPLE